MLDFQVGATVEVKDFGPGVIVRRDLHGVIVRLENLGDSRYLLISLTFPYGISTSSI